MVSGKKLASLFSLVGIVSAFHFPYLSGIRHKQFLTSNDVSTQQFKTPLSKTYGPFTMDMPLDHFNKNQTGTNVTFSNRYWINADHYKKNGPIILSNGGEGAVENPGDTIFDSVMAQLAERLEGIFVYMEHRYYGESTPKNLDYRYLMTDQALADMAYLIKNIEFNHSLQVPPVPETNVIVYGCSYSGNLAAWMRKKYDDLVFAAVASSAPVEAQINFYQYFDPIIRYGPKQCIQAIQEMITFIDSILFGNSSEAVHQLKKQFGVEGLYDDDFAAHLSQAISYYWQYGISSEKNEFDETICTNIFNSTSIQKNIQAYASYLKHSLKDSCNSFNSIQDCLGTHNVSNIVSQMEQTPDTASWVWQTCTEFGYFQVAAPQDKATIVSRKLQTTMSERMCKMYFGTKGMSVPKQPDVKKTNSVYGGWSIKLDRVLWVDGEWDSWRELSVLSEHANRHDIHNGSVIIIPKATHCANIQGINKNSPQYLIDIQDQQYNTLKNWLEQDN